MEALAKLRGCPMSARKMRLVADHIRNMEVGPALDTLKFTRKEASTWLEKLLVSAINNWGEKTGQDPEDFKLYIKTLLVDEGPMMKRFRPAPYGRAHRIRKRSNHVTIVVANKIAIEGDFDEEE